jgi:hypothetical protein
MIVNDGSGIMCTETTHARERDLLMVVGVQAESPMRVFSASVGAETVLMTKTFSVT